MSSRYLEKKKYEQYYNKIWKQVKVFKNMLRFLLRKKKQQSAFKINLNQKRIYN